MLPGGPRIRQEQLARAKSELASEAPLRPVQLSIGKLVGGKARITWSLKGAITKTATLATASLAVPATSRAARGASTDSSRASSLSTRLKTRAGAASKAAGRMDRDKENYADASTMIVSLANIRAWKTTKALDHLNPMCLEMYLSNDEFASTFGIAKEEFYAQRQWQQRQMKKSAGLF